MRSVFCLPLVFATAALTCIGCVSSGRFHAMERQAHLSDSLYNQSMRTLKGCQDDNTRLTKDKATLKEQNKDMSQQVTAANEVNGQLRKQMEQLSAVSSAQAESIKRSLDNMGARDNYMIALHSAITSRDSVNLAMLLYLKQAIGGYGEQDVRIRLERGAVNVDLSDSLLFDGDSAGYVVSEKAKPVLSRLARALNDQTDVDFTIEGRVDSLATPADSTHDNWDLGLRRATAIIHILQNDQVAPTRMTAAARFAPAPIGTGDSADLSAGHWTRVRIVPQTERLQQLLDRGQVAPAPAGPAVSGS